MKNKVNIKMISIILAVTFLTGGFNIFINAMDYHQNTQNALLKVKAKNDIDRKTAEDIADMAGVSVTRILEEKSSGKNWNKIISDVKVGRENYQYDLSSYSKEEIEEATEYAERYIGYLEEILERHQKDYELTISKVTVLPEKESDQENIEQLKNLSEKLERNKTIWVLLKLKNDFNGLIKAFNEYLYALQSDINIELYFEDPEEYRKQIKEKEAFINRLEAITLTKIEQEFIASLQKQDDRKLDKEKTLIQDDLVQKNSILNIPSGESPNPKPVSPREKNEKEQLNIWNRAMN